MSKRKNMKEVGGHYPYGLLHGPERWIRERVFMPISKAAKRQWRRRQRQANKTEEPRP